METIVKTLKSCASSNFTPQFLIPVMLRHNNISIMHKLMMMGYEREYHNFKYNLEGKNIVCEYDRFHATDSDNKPHCVDCGDDEDLFLILASLTPATIVYFQDDEMFICNTDDAIPANCKRATTEDILAHFKK